MSIPLESQSFDYTPSKWIHLSFFFTTEELKDILSSFEKLYFFSLKNPLYQSEICKSKKDLVDTYDEEIATFLQGEKKEYLKEILPLALTSDPHDLSLKKLADERVLVCIRKPLVLVRPHYFAISELDQRITKGNAIFWGIQFSYPLVYIDPVTQQIKEGMKAPNAALFTYLRKWARSHTKLAHFKMRGELIKSPYRISSAMRKTLREKKHCLPSFIELCGEK